MPEFYAFQCFLFHLSLHNIIGAQQQHGLRGGGLDQSRSPTNGGGHRLYQQQLGAWVLKERPIHLVTGLSFSLSRLFFTSRLSTLGPPLLASSGTWSTRCLQYNQLRLLLKKYLSDGDKDFETNIFQTEANILKKYFLDGDQPDRVPVRVPTAVLAGGVQAASSTWETFSGARCGDLRLRISSGLP